MVQEYRYRSVFNDFLLVTSFKKIRLLHFDLTDKDLEAIAKRCLLLEKVELTCGRLITDSSISFLLQNCCHLGTLHLHYCDNITGIGFLGCPETLTNLKADYCKLTPERISAIVSGGGLEYLRLCRGVPKFKTETIMTISKGCPLLKELSLSDCEEVEPEGWQTIGQNCKYLERLYVFDEEGYESFVQWK
ncbi:hypothetical protein MKW98_030137 [Papaver atlanticum]|uniref:Uncharacterized protein n=1 Tax=Papaver atlanticum TaxID=357466 RepID=A0AAD4XT18_9MAGN|nr:hypothetical protein MKW98_030137 [Papaver atlanticum]